MQKSRLNRRRLRWQSNLEEANQVDQERQATLKSEQDEWAVQESEYRARQDAANAEVDAFRRNYEQGGSDDIRAVEEHAELVLNASEYPDWFSVDFELGYNGPSKTIIVEYRLPSEDSIPTVKSVAYIQKPKRDKAKFYLRTREVGAIRKTFFTRSLCVLSMSYTNLMKSPHLMRLYSMGWIEAVDPATGQLRNSCIMSVQARPR